MVGVRVECFPDGAGPRGLFRWANLAGMFCRRRRGVFFLNLAILARLLASESDESSFFYKREDLQNVKA